MDGMNGLLKQKPEAFTAGVLKVPVWGVSWGVGRRPILGTCGTVGTSVLISRGAGSRVRGMANELVGVGTLEPEHISKPSCIGSGGGAMSKRV